jgi:hypothetical protein
VGGAEPNSGSGLGWPHRSRRGTRWTAARRQPARPGYTPHGRDSLLLSRGRAKASGPAMAA